MSSGSRNAQQIESEIDETTNRLNEINDQMSALRTERDELHEKRFTLKRELLEALGRELEVAKESK